MSGILHNDDDSEQSPSKRFSRDLQCSFFACRGGNGNDFQLISCSTCLVFLPIYTQIHRTIWINRFIFMTRFFFWFWWDCKKSMTGLKFSFLMKLKTFTKRKKLIQNFSWFWILIRFSKVQLIFVSNYNHEDQRNHNSINKLNYIKTPFRFCITLANSWHTYGLTPWLLSWTKLSIVL